MAKPKFKIKHTITKKEWNKTHKDFKSIINGVHYVMKLTDKGTALVPVNIEESVNEAKKFTVKKLGDDYYPYGLYYGNNLVSGLRSNSKKEVENAIQSISKALGIGESVNEGKDPEIITQLRDVVKNGYKTLKDPKSGKRMKVDTYSASAIVGVYDKLSSSNKEKFVKQGLLGMQSLAFKFIK
jgi:phage-related protein